MDNHIKIGKMGEREAAKFLKKKGYHIIQSNFRCRFGEIDLIARHKDTLVFIEVKTRKNNLYGTPGQAVNKTKQKKIVKTALYYLKRNDLYDENVRFDIVEVWQHDHKVKSIHVISNAFFIS
ncbi:YraN family protein [Garciella nitratireducens]|uniref:UPF0102 protein SAMN02745973_00187 n=1 Tax=Garciella nitratireducens DSM 15102 TaxID=1121911 RepID=A0A1T4JX90_9FIRM|nr:YraN family protein [Garciella nitratireducens]RBP41147.1 putative endonuclease [Garciella nitratireducens]SJZ34872.1 putative endonuclease [Garciella nitratireducens DSM 15102]